MDNKPIFYTSDKAIQDALIQFSIYSLFVLSATIVALSSRHLYMFYLNEAITQRFFIQEFYGTVDEWWMYITQAVIAQLPASDDSNSTDPDAERKLFQQNLLLGPPRLRQMRVVSTSCTAPKIFMKGLTDCYPGYSSWYEDTESVYKGKWQLGALSVTGRAESYRGGGYVQQWSYKDNAETIQKLAREKWIDIATRVVILEFGVYNDATDLFDNVKFIADVLPTGGVISSGQVTAVKLYGVWSSDIWLVIAALVFYCLIGFYTVVEIREMKRSRSLYLRDAWNIIDGLILILAYLLFIYSVFHPLYLNSILDDSREHPAKHHSLDYISYTYVLYLNSTAICAFLIWIKIFRYIHFSQMTLRLVITFKKCYQDLLGFSVLIMLIIFGYAWLGYLWFGTAHADFLSFEIAFWSVMRMMLCDFDYEGVDKANHVLGPIYFLVFILLVFFILINMFLAIILDAFQEAKDEAEKTPNQFGAYFKRLWGKYTPILKQKLKLSYFDKPQKEAKRVQLNPVKESNETSKTPQEKTSVPEMLEATRVKRNSDQLKKLKQHVELLEKICAKLKPDLAQLQKDINTPTSSKSPSTSTATSANQQSKPSGSTRDKTPTTKDNTNEPRQRKIIYIPKQDP